MMIIYNTGDWTLEHIEDTYDHKGNRTDQTLFVVSSADRDEELHLFESLKDSIEFFKEVTGKDNLSIIQ